MKKLFFLAAFLIPMLTSAQDITGTWEGKASISGTDLRIVFHIDQQEGSYKGTMDSPDQGVKGIPISGITFDGTALAVEIASLAFVYTGNITDAENIDGSFAQSGFTFPLALKKKD